MAEELSNINMEQEEEREKANVTPKSPKDRKKKKPKYDSDDDLSLQVKENGEWKSYNVKVWETGEVPGGEGIQYKVRFSGGAKDGQLYRHGEWVPEFRLKFA